MAKQALDRRARRTRATLQQAHLELILKKGYDATTIQDICNAANVGRSTFYAHYRSKDDLRRSGFEHLRTLLAERQASALASTAEGDERRLAFSLTLFEHARERIQLYRALVGTRGGTLGLATIRKILADLVHNELAAAASPSPADLPRELVVQYVVGAFMALLTWWLDRGAKVPPEQMDAMFRHMTNQGIWPARTRMARP
jgi:AcrR family transcriptional regulator